MKLATLCYVKDHGKTLMLYRNKNQIIYQKDDFGLRAPKSTSHGAFFTTCFSSCLHHNAINVRQDFDPSMASSLGNSAISHLKSQNLILLLVTPAFFDI